MTTFLDLPPEQSRYQTSTVAILPVPFECTTSYIRGTEHGPAAIIEASTQVELYDNHYACEPADCGICTLPPLSYNGGGVSAFFSSLTAAVARIIADDKFPVILGGEHSISAPVYSAFREHYSDAHIGVIHFDAHADLRDTYEDSAFSHACVMRRIREQTDKTISLGIRSLSSEEAAYIRNQDIPLFFAGTAGMREKLSAALEKLPNNIFVTFDVDAFDPALVPAVGTPEPGGFGWAQALNLCRQIFTSKNVVGMDIVELCPQDGAIVSDFTVARFIYKLIGFKLFESGT